MRRRKYSSSYTGLLMVVLIAFVICLYLTFKTLPLGQQDPVTISAKLTAVEIVDGDTFIASNGEKIRLLGIDTPEKGEAFALEAEKYLLEMLTDQEIRLELDYRKRDKYNRLLAYVFTDEVFINRELLRTGLASVYIFPASMRNFDYRDMFISEQKTARNNAVGIWSLPQPESEDTYFGNSRTLRFHRPDCYSAQKMDSSIIIKKDSRDEFLDMGFSGCRNCNP